MILGIVSQSVGPQPLACFRIAVDGMEPIVLVTKNSLGRWQVIGTILYLVEAGHLEALLCLPDVHQPGVAAAGDAFQRVTRGATGVSSIS